MQFSIFNKTLENKHHQIRKSLNDKHITVISPLVREYVKQENEITPDERIKKYN